MKKLIIAHRALAVFFIFGISSFVNAQGEVKDFQNNKEQVDITETHDNAMVVATVNIYNPIIISQDNNKFTISFDLYNRVGHQSDIKYAIQLVKNDKDVQSIVDEEIYQETLSLGENQVITKEIIYQAPGYLSGNFKMAVVAKSGNGFPFASGLLGDVVLGGDNQYLEIVYPTCYLKIVGGVNDKTYSPLQKVEIGSSDSLVAHCNVKNNLNSDAVIIPQLKTYSKSRFGELVGVGEKVQAGITLKAKESTSLDIAFPEVVTRFQEYETVLRLVGKNGDSISNDVSFFYANKGPRAFIDNLLFDKNVYTVGETANIEIVWSSLSVENVKINISIHNDQKLICSELEKDLNKKNGPIINFNLPIKNNCLNPELVARIVDKDGNILDEKNIKLGTVEVKQPADTGPVNDAQAEGKLPLIVMVIIVIIAIIFLLVAIYFKKLRMMIFISLLWATALFGANQVEADTFVSADDMSGAGHVIYFNVNLNKSTYSQGENITVSGSTWSNYDEFMWNSGDDLYILLRTTINGQVNTLYTYSGYDSDSPLAAGIPLTGSATRAAPTAAGSYNASIVICGLMSIGDVSCANSVYWHYYTLPYTVTAPSTCTGTTPLNATLVPGDDTGLSADTVKTVVSSNSVAKCEYLCNAGYHKDGNSCVLNFQDIGLKIRDNGVTYSIAIEQSCDANKPLRIAEGGTIYCIALVDVGDTNATSFKIKTSAGIKALRKY